MSLEILSNQICTIDHQLKQEAGKAVNQFLTIRNWLIGYYIVEYEQQGEDRARYGEKLIDNLADKMDRQGLSGRNLKVYKQFYQAYPQLGPSVSEKLGQIKHKIPGIELSKNPSRNFVTSSPRIVQTPSAQFQTAEKEEVEKQNEIVRILPELQTPPEKLLRSLSFSKFSELMRIQNPIKRTFYEIECIRGNWSVKELKRQIYSLYYERSGMSKNPKKLMETVQGKAERQTPQDIIKNVYTFEFLGIPIKHATEERDLEQALLDHLQEFILELGRGFCFEGRQKRILIGDEYFFVDLVFYHRILRCHVLIDLKIGKFSHTDAGQLNAYLTHYRREVMEDFDQPPVGILLVTDKNDTLVEYATAGLDENLFVKSYMLQLPSEDQLKAVILEELERL